MQVLYHGLETVDFGFEGLEVGGVVGDLEGVDFGGEIGVGVKRWGCWFWRRGPHFATPFAKAMGARKASWGRFLDAGDGLGDEVG